MSCPASPSLHHFPPERGRVGPQEGPGLWRSLIRPQSGGGRDTEAARALWRAGLVLRLRLPATLQPPVTASCPPRVAPPPFLRGGIWEGLPWPCLRVAWECLGIWIQPALDLDVR